MSRRSLTAAPMQPTATSSDEPCSEAAQHSPTPSQDSEEERVERLSRRGPFTLNTQASNQSIGEAICRICHLDEASLPELGILVSPCQCRGTMALVHVSCLERWLTECGSDQCELCGFRFRTERIPRHNLFCSIGHWMLASSDTKLLIFDIIWFLMATPVAMFATYLMMLSVSVIQQHGTLLQQSGLALFLLTTSCLLLTTYYVWLVNCFRQHLRDWYRWWRRNFTVRVIYAGERRAQDVVAQSAT